MKKHGNPSANDRKGESGKCERCPRCPFRTKTYATRAECGHCPNHARGCKELSDYQRALMMLLSPY